MQPLRSNIRVLAASMVGTAVEYYDFYLYGYAAAMVFGPLFFPVRSAAAQTLLALMSFGIAFIARPIGAVVFGHFGDRIGRKATLVASLLLMGICTFAIAFLPTYASVGWLAPTLLCLMRFGQGFGLGGEWAGAALLSVEHAPKGWDARFAIAPPFGANLGNISATTIFVLLTSFMTNELFTRWGWRLAFLASGVLIALGLWVRLRIGETPEFRAALERAPPPRVPIVQLFTADGWAVLAGAVGIIGLLALVYMAGPFALAQASGPLGYDRNSFLLVQLIALIVPIPTLLFGARWADRTSSGRMVALGAFASVPLGLFFGPGLSSGSLTMVGLTLAAASFCWALINCGLSAWLCRLYPVRVRYSGFAFAFNTGGIIGGAVLPIIAQMMSAAGSLNYVGLLLSITGLMTIAAVKLSQPAKETFTEQSCATPAAAS
jgi:MFS family permease